MKCDKLKDVLNQLRIWKNKRREGTGCFISKPERKKESESNEIKIHHEARCGVRFGDHVCHHDAPSVSAIANTSITSTTEILNLKTNNYTIPLTVEDANPVFSWEMDSNLIGQQQKTYQIVVTRDSGRVEESQSNDVYYQGEALTAEIAYSWDLTVWDAFGQSYTRETRA